MNSRSMSIARNLITNVRTHGELVVQGMAALAAVRDAIQLLSAESGFRLEFDPTSDPTLVDYLAVTGGRAAQGGLVGGALGLLLGALLDHPLEGAVLGAGFGATVGVLQGLDVVSRGWRVRAIWLPNGSPSIAVYET